MESLPREDSLIKAEGAEASLKTIHRESVAGM